LKVYPAFKVYFIFYSYSIAQSLEKYCIVEALYRETDKVFMELGIYS